MNPLKFGDYAKDRRIVAGMTLRSFCREAEIDPSNWSKIERGVLAPPDDPELLGRIAGLLGLKSSEQTDLADLAAIARGQIPADLKDEEILAKMPAFFRAIRGQEYTREDFEKLMSGVSRGSEHRHGDSHHEGWEDRGDLPGERSAVSDV